MLRQLLKTPKHPQLELYSYLPVSTSLEQQLKKEAEFILSEVDKKKNMHKIHNEQFVSNQNPENIKSDLIMLKLKGYIDRRNLTAKNQELKKLPSKVQVGRIIEGQPFMSKGKIKNRKQEKSLVQHFVDLDKNQSFSNRKFSQIQRNKQRVKKISKKSILKAKNKGKKNK